MAAKTVRGLSGIFKGVRFGSECGACEEIRIGSRKIDLGKCVRLAVPAPARGGSADRRTVRDPECSDRGKRPNAECWVKRFDAACCEPGELGCDEAYHPIGRERR